MMPPISSLVMLRPEQRHSVRFLAPSMEISQPLRSTWTSLMFLLESRPRNRSLEQKKCTSFCVV
ncbi:hypothetical protein DPMN_170847 [Dreissena polymorpha]|uniref:Uncharacterized protein n=1 Tax=Dreissena polymorpha TaxID=45954 RepID=A0A9D4E054_DREPO|nr:hypothetical protein DPMN_170847 [Dreissena polymorpha]